MPLGMDRREDRDIDIIDVAINGLTVADARLGVGGGIGTQDANVTLTGMTVTRNSAFIIGGGVAHMGDGSLTIRDSTIFVAT